MQRRSGLANDGLLFAIGALVLAGGLSWFIMRAPENSRPASVGPIAESGHGGGTSETDVAGKGDGTGETSKQGGISASANPAGSAQSNKTLVMYCAAGIKKPVSAAAKAFQEEYGIEIQLQYGGSGTLLSNLQLAKRGDLYLAADSGYTNIARDKGLLNESVPLAFMRPAIAVRKGNPKRIKTLDDLLRDDVKVALANPDAASVGKLTKKLLTQSGHWDKLSAVVKVFKPTVTEIATDVMLGAVDAAVVWDATAKQTPDKLDLVRVPAFDAATKDVTIGILKWCKFPTNALKFARYLQARDKGQQKFTEFGFETIDGDEWAESPELILYSGGVNRLAIQDTIREFEAREGVRVNVLYNGCGILVGMINSSEQNPPDAYFACDASFMTQVQSKFKPSLTVSQTPMVVIVQKGNPQEIKSVTDLTKAGLKLGVANEEQSALGALTRNLFQKIKFGDGDLFAAIQDNIKVRTPTADLLVNQLRVGALDAAVVYQANVSFVKDKLEVITITEGDPTAVQPIAVNKKSRYPYLTQRLVDAIASNRSQQRFLDCGFGWRITTEAK